jgi:Na+/H+ antiporter NhaC
MGLVIFFDDYANTLIVGNTMRPFTDRLRISREKLAYIVDSTAAPVASIALVSTWIGFQVGLVDSSFKAVGITSNAYAVFLESIPYASYSILALFFVLLISITLRDFGPMAAAERRAQLEGKLLSDEAQPITDSSALDMSSSADVPKRWYNALLPITVVIAITLAGLYINGKIALGEAASDVSLGEIFGAANSFDVLMWASFAGLLTAGLLALGQRILTVSETMEAAINGYKSMLLAAMILVLAWAIGDICAQLKTADYVIDVTRGILKPHLIPVVTFIIAAFISFSTGSSWATMAILTPIVVPIANELPLESALSAGLAESIMLATIGAVLSGSVLGDHCSPISDTTILSSMASASDHLDHVRTQIPYALIVALVAILCGYLPSGWGFNPYLSILTGGLLLTALLMLFGKRVQP